MFNPNMLEMVCLITKSVYEGERRLRWFYRDEPIGEANPYDSGWFISSEFDDEEYMKNPDNIKTITIEELIKIEPRAELIVEMPVGTEIMVDFEKDALINTATDEEITEAYEPLLPRAFNRNLDILSEIPKDVKMIEELFDSEKFEIIRKDDLYFEYGVVILSDPYYMVEGEDMMDVMEDTILPGKYSVDISSKETEELGRRIFATKINITDKKAVKYVELKPEYKEWQVVGVDTGLCGIADRSAQTEFRRFYQKWKAQNPGKNFYNDYLDEFFKEDVEIAMWKSEETDNNILITSTGFGDGVYNPLCGFDSDGKLANIVTIFIAPEIAEME